MIFPVNFVSSFLIQHEMPTVGVGNNLSWFSGGGVNLFAFKSRQNNLKRRLMAGLRRHLTDITGSHSISYAISDNSRGGLVKIGLVKDTLANNDTENRSWLKRSLQRFAKLFFIPLSITVSPIYNVCLMLPNSCDNALHASAYIRNRVGQLKGL